MIWRNLKCIILNKRSQSEKTTYCMIPTIGHTGKGRTIETGKGLVVARGLGREGCIDRVHRIFRAVKLLEILYIYIYISANIHLSRCFPGGSVVKNPSANAGDVGSVSGLGRPPEEGNGNPLQYSCLENPMDRGALWALTHTKSRTWLSNWAQAGYTCQDMERCENSAFVSILLQT